MYRPGMFAATRAGVPLPSEPAAAAAPRQSNADWGAFGRRGGAAGGAGSEHHAAFGRRQPRDSRDGRRDDRPRAPVAEFVPSNSLTAYLNQALTAAELKEAEWQTRLRGLQKKRDAPALAAPVAERPKPVDLTSETAFPTLGAASAAPKNTWAPKAQSFASLMKKHVEDDAEAARVEAERKAAEERARKEREREERRYRGMPSLARISASNVNSYIDDDEEYDYNPEGDLDYQYNAVRREEPEVQAEAVEAEEEEDDDSFEHVEDSW